YNPQQMVQRKTDGSTVGLSGTGLSAEALGQERPRQPLPTLTVLYHPDLRRIGNLLTLAELPLGREALISRYQPELTAPGQLTGQPLADSYISRRPLRLRATADGGVEILLGESRTSVVAQGTSILQASTFSRQEIDRGVTLELAARVVLLLHRAMTVPARMPPPFGLTCSASPISRCRCCCAARPEPARSSSPAPSTAPAPAATQPSWPSTWERSRRPCRRRSCSAASRGRSPARWRIRKATSAAPMAARCSSTRSARRRRRCR